MCRGSAHLLHHVQHPSPRLTPGSTGAAHGAQINIQPHKAPVRLRLGPARRARRRSRLSRRSRAPGCADGVSKRT